MTRLPARLLVDLLLRSAVAGGGFATVLARGDDHGGAVLIQCRDRGAEGPLLERLFDGLWQPVGPESAAGPAERDAYIARRRRADPDLWLIELDIPDAPQFVAELTHGA
ncbi:MAG: DUF1491 family protein [Sphingopyxis sp.]|nr:DUF1491 family protein [Sphingopyxis sp.]